jgi:hypothetical protein
VAPLIFALSIPVNSAVFLTNMFYSDYHNKDQKTYHKYLIGIDALLKFSDITEEFIEGCKLDKMDLSKISTVTLTQLTQEKLHVIDDIRDILYPMYAKED